MIREEDRLCDLQNVEEARSISELELGSINVTWDCFTRNSNPVWKTSLQFPQSWVWKWLYRETGKLVTRSCKEQTEPDSAAPEPLPTTAPAAGRDHQHHPYLRPPCSANA